MEKKNSSFYKVITTGEAFNGTVTSRTTTRSKQTSTQTTTLETKKSSEEPIKEALLLQINSL